MHGYMNIKFKVIKAVRSEEMGVKKKIGVRHSKTKLPTRKQIWRNWSIPYLVGNQRIILKMMMSLDVRESVHRASTEPLW